MENIYYKERRRKLERIDFYTSGWMEKIKRTYTFVGMLCPSLSFSAMVTATCQNTGVRHVLMKEFETA